MQFFIDTDLQSTERFDLGKFLEYNVDHYDVLNSRFLNDLSRDLTPTGEFEIRTEETRSDIVSQDIYGGTQFWWVVLFFNAILDVEDFESGNILSFPAIADLEDKFFNLKALEVTASR